MVQSIWSLITIQYMQIKVNNVKAHKDIMNLRTFLKFYKIYDK